MLRELGNPSSNLRRQLEDTAHKEGGGQLSDLDIKKAIPELKDVDLPDGVLSLQDLVDASERGFAPPPEPERSKPSRQEQLRAQQAIKAVFPPDVAEELGEMDLHPDDISDLVSSFRAAKDRPTGHRDIASLAKTMSAGGYNLDPESVDVPEKDEEGRRFEDLEPDDQAKVYAKHKMSLLATSLAAREKVKQGLKDTGLPDEVAHRLAHEMLSGGERDASDEEVRTFYKQALATAALDDPLSDAQIKKLLKTVGDNPVAKKLAVAYLQAKDYADARETYLDKDPEHPDRQIKEWDNVRTIASKLTDASEFLRERSARYPQDAVVEEPGMAFRNRVIDRLGALTPEAVPFVRSYLEDYEMGAFKDKAKGFDRSFKKFTEAAEKERRALEKERAKAKPGGDVYRQEGEKRSLDEEIEARLRKRGIHRPRRPTPPPGYEFWTDREKVESRGSKSWDWFKKLWKKKNKASSTDHVALRALVPSIRQRVAFRHSISSYPGDRTMGQPSSAVRTAVYWGQEPYEGTAPYPGWTQVHARDLTEKDFNGLVGAAREWLKAPVLGREIKGMVRDTQLRAALDLAIRDHEGGRYSVGLHPTVYNQLLARLSGQDGPYDLLTGKPTDVPRIGSQQARKPMEFTYGRPTGERVQTMKASSHVRMFASRAAAEERDLELAFDMMAFADHLANQEGQGGQGQEGGEQQAPAQTEQQKQAAVRIAAQQLGKFRELRSLIIRTAHAHPEAQAAFWPLLQAIKG